MYTYRGGRTIYSPHLEFESMFTISMKSTADVNIAEAALLPNSPYLWVISVVLA